MADRYAAFLRAVNLGSTRKVSGEQLRSIFEQLGFEDVATFRTSGNVVFSAAEAGAASKLESRIEEGLADELGFEVPVFARSEAEIKAIAKHEPFPAKAVKASAGKLQVVLLEKKPSAAARKKVTGLASEDDRLALKGVELYWLPSGGTQRSGLDLKTIEKALGPMTIRTMGTIEQIAQKFFGYSP